MKKLLIVIIILVSVIAIIVLAFVGHQCYTLYPSGWGEVVREARKENPLIKNITCRASRSYPFHLGVDMKKDTMPEDVDAAVDWLRNKVFTEEVYSIICEHYRRTIDKSDDNPFLRIYIDISCGGEYKYMFCEPFTEGDPWTVHFFGKSDVYRYSYSIYRGSLAESIAEALLQ